MRVNKNYWLAASGTLAVASAMMLFSAHRIEAQFSQPVRVLNTSSGPAIASLIDDPGRTPYQAVQNLTPQSSSTFLIFTFGAVPANHRLVVHHISGLLGVAPNSPAAIVGLAVTGNGGFTPSSFFAPSLGTATAFDQPVLVYYDAGQQPTVLISGPTFPANFGDDITMTGYLLDCSAAPCAAIAH
jgi:hypothetical protein